MGLDGDWYNQLNPAYPVETGVPAPPQPAGGRSSRLIVLRERLKLKSVPESSSRPPSAGRAPGRRVDETLRRDQELMRI